MTDKEFREMLARVLNPEASVHAKASGTPTYYGDYGVGGLFGACGFENTLINAVCGPGDGIIDAIPWKGTDLDYTKWDVLTAVRTYGGAPSSDCETCETSFLKVCTLNTCFGQYCASTEEISLLQFGTRVPGATTRRLLGGIPGLPASLTLDNRELTPAEMLLVAAGYTLRGIVQPAAWSGNRALNPPPGETDMNGLEILINTGLVDALDGDGCAPIDSDVKPFHGCIGDAGASDIVRLLTAIKRQVDHRLTAARLNPGLLRREIWIRMELWDAVASAWPILYTLMASPWWQTTNTSPTSTISQEAVFKLWEEIRSRQALPIDSEWFPVKFDSGITGAYDGDASRFQSDIFFLGMGYDREPLIYGEYQDFSLTLASLLRDPTFGALFKNGINTILDGGRYLGHVDSVIVCADATVWIKPRILVKAPWMSGRVTDVCAHLIQPYCGPDYNWRDFHIGHDEQPPEVLYGPCETESQGV